MSQRFVSDPYSLVELKVRFAANNDKTITEKSLTFCILASYRVFFSQIFVNLFLTTEVKISTTIYGV